MHADWKWTNDRGERALADGRVLQVNRGEGVGDGVYFMEFRIIAPGGLILRESAIVEREAAVEAVERAAGVWVEPHILDPRWMVVGHDGPHEVVMLRPLAPLCPHAAASARTGETFQCSCAVPIERDRNDDPPQTALQAAVEREAEFAAHEKTLVTPPTHGVMRDVVGMIVELKADRAAAEERIAALEKQLAEERVTTKCTLTPKQQGAVLGLAQLYLACDRTQQIFNIKTRRIQSSRDYVNGVLRELGIEGVFRAAPPVRDIKTLVVTNERGKVLEGKVTKNLEHTTRREPKKAVAAYLSGGWWRPKFSADPLAVKVLVRVVRRPAPSKS